MVDHELRLQLDRSGSTPAPRLVEQVQLQLERAHEAARSPDAWLQEERLQLEREPSTLLVALQESPDCVQFQNSHAGVSPVFAASLEALAFEAARTLISGEPSRCTT